MTRVIFATMLALTLRTSAFAQEPAPPPTTEQLQSALQQLQTAIGARDISLKSSRDEVDKLAQQVAQLTQALNNVIPTLEARNPEYTIDQQTLKIGPKAPTAQAAKVVPATAEKPKVEAPSTAKK